MLLPDRRESIMKVLRERHSISVRELSKQLFISETSIRRDLTYLENSGLLRKTYGGAVLLTGENQLLSLEARQRTEAGAKSAIARKAVSIIADGSVIFMDSSSTVLAMAPYLDKFNTLTVITNGAKIALALVEHSNIQVYCTGGLLTHHIFSYSGSMACETIKGIFADIFFVSPKALDIDKGAFCASEEETAIRRAMLNNCRKTVLLCNRQKMGRNAPFHLCCYEQIDAIVSDEEPEAKWQECFQKYGIALY